MATHTTHKPQKPTPDFPLTPHGSGKWCKKIAGKLRYFGTWADPAGALREFENSGGKAKQPSGAVPSAAVPKVPKDFPLYAHRNGQWAKTIGGKKFYFGPVSDPDAAKKRYQEERADLEAGRTPASREGKGLRLRDLINQFDNSKRVAVSKGRLHKETYRQYQAAEKRLLEFFGPDRIVESLAPIDFDKYAESLPDSWGLVTLRNFVVYTRAIFRYAADDDIGLIDRPVRFGKVFSQPKKRDLKVERNKRPAKFFEAKEIRLLLSKASPTMKAMILLGVNCGFGNLDVGELTKEIYSPSSDWLDYARNKTGVDRRCHLWPETKAAIKDAMEKMPEPQQEYEHLVFVSRYGRGWYCNGPSAISLAFRKLAKKCGLYQTGRSFYSFRHVFQTIGEKSGDFAAVKAVMGHEPDAGDMSAHYREKIDDERLINVSTTVRTWLFPPASR